MTKGLAFHSVVAKRIIVEIDFVDMSAIICYLLH